MSQIVKPEDLETGDEIEIVARVTVEARDTGLLWLRFAPYSRTAQDFSSRELAAMTITRLEKPLAVGDRVRYASNPESTPGEILAVDGSWAFVRIASPHAAYCESIELPKLVRV